MKQFRIFQFCPVVAHPAERRPGYMAACQSVPNNKVCVVP